MNTLRTIAPLAPNTPLSSVRRQPTRAPSVASDAGVPFVQAGIGGLLISTSLMIAVLGISWLAGVNLLTLEAQIAIGAAWGALAILGTTILWWGRLNAAQHTIWFTEQLLNTNLDQNPAIGRPHGLTLNPGPETPDPVAVMAGKTAAMLRACFARTATTWNSIRGDLPDFDESGIEYAQIRDELIRIKLAAWRGAKHNHGWTFRPGLSLAEALQAADEKIAWI
jgi:hypothetical protein